MKISTILNQVDLGAIALPEFQRGYVWNRNQVRELMNSLYRRYPVGGLLVWATKTEHADARGDGPLTPGYVKLLHCGNISGWIFRSKRTFCGQGLRRCSARKRRQ